MGKHKKHHHGHGYKHSSSSSSSSSSDSDGEYKHLPKHERKRMKKLKKQMKKGIIPPGSVPGVYPGGHGKHGHGSHGHHPAGHVPHGHGQYPAGQYPAAGYPAGTVPPPQPGYPGGFVQPPPPAQYPAPSGYPGASNYPQAPPQPAYPAAPGYPQGGVPPPGGAYPQTGGSYPTGQAGYQPGSAPSYPAQPTAAGGFVAPQPGGATPSTGGFVVPPGGASSTSGGFAAPQPGGATSSTGGFVAPPPGGAAPATGGFVQPPQGGGQYGYGTPQQPPPAQPHMSGAPAPGGTAPGMGSATAGMSNLKLQTADMPRPTIRPANPFSAEKDAEVLRKAMKGLGTDEKAIIDVISARSNQQRQQILTMFKTMYGKDLIKDLASELSGEIEELVMAMFKPPAYFDAWSLHKAMTGVGTKEHYLIEILCTRTNAEIKDIVQNYQKHFGRSLEQDITNDTSGYFKRLLISCCQGNRAELTYDQLQRVAQQGAECVVDRALAQQDAQKLFQAGEKKIGTDESAFLSIMAIRHYYQLRATFEEYHKIAGRDILDTVGREMSGDLEDGFKAIVLCAKNRPRYFAERLYKAMKGIGTQDSTLIRIIVSRSEIDLQDIKEEYLVNHHKSLHAAVASETSGDYKKLLLAIIGQ